MKRINNIFDTIAGMDNCRDAVVEESYTTRCSRYGCGEVMREFQNAIAKRVRARLLGEYKSQEAEGFWLTEGPKERWIVPPTIFRFGMHSRRCPRVGTAFVQAHDTAFVLPDQKSWAAQIGEGLASRLAQACPRLRPMERVARFRAVPAPRVLPEDGHQEVLSVHHLQDGDACDGALREGQARFETDCRVHELHRWRSNRRGIFRDDCARRHHSYRLEDDCASKRAFVLSVYGRCDHPVSFEISGAQGAFVHGKVAERNGLDHGEQVANLPDRFAPGHDWRLQRSPRFDSNRGSYLAPHLPSSSSVRAIRQEESSDFRVSIACLIVGMGEKHAIVQPQKEMETRKCKMHF